MDLTTVADDRAVVHDGTKVRRYDDLRPDTVHAFDGFTFRTLARPAGERLAVFATVNDVHFGEVECGLIKGVEMGPTFRVAEGETPYPEIMSRAAIAEIAQIDPVVVVAKGDLTSAGSEEEHQLFTDFYGEAFGDRLVEVRGNHDAHHGVTFAAEPTQRIELPGAVLAVLDTALAGQATGHVTGEQLEWLDDLAAEADRPVYVFGHHPVWGPEDGAHGHHFGIDPESSVRLIELVAARPTISGYFAGHTHRNRVRRFSVSRDVPWAEVACVKDFPGAWAEYHVYEAGLLQIFHRISTPEAMEWSEKTRQMFAGMYFDYAFGELADRCFAVPARSS